MNILIIDDDFYSVKAIQDNVNWNKITNEICNVFTAYNTGQAKSIFTKEVIEIAICDIEMPRENGIELINWLRETNYPAEVIIITCHSEFSYAKQAIALDVYDYCVKPIDFFQIESILIKLIREINLKRGLYEHYKLGEYWIESLGQLIKNFWESIVLYETERPINDLVTESKKLSLSFSANTLFQVVLIELKSYQVSLTKWNHQKIIRSLMSLTKEILDEAMESNNVIATDSAVIVICENREFKWITEKCKVLIDTANDLIKINICCYISEQAYLNQLHECYKRLNDISFQDVCHLNSILIEGINNQAIPVQMLDIPNYIIEEFELGRFKDFYYQLHLWMKQQLNTKELNRETLNFFRENFLQLTYYYLMKIGYSARILQQDAKFKESLLISNTSLKAMEVWMQLVIEKLEQLTHDRCNINQLQKSIQEMKKYIQENLSENLTRDQIAEAVHLNTDYAARIFKKYENESLMEYLSKKRISKAVYLMKTSNLTINEIASESGFINSSHFSTAFKRVTGLSPREYRSTNLNSNA